MEQQSEAEFYREPEKVQGKHRFMAGTCVDCGKPLAPVCVPAMDQQSNEQIVRDAVGGVLLKWTIRDGNTRRWFVAISAGSWQGNIRLCGEDDFETKEEAWAAALVWLESRKQEIAEIREEIEIVRDDIECGTEAIYERILTKRLLPDLERLTKGLKEVQGE